MAKFRLANGTEVELPDDAIDRAYALRHPATTPAGAQRTNPADGQRTITLRTIDGRENVYSERVIRAAAAALDGRSSTRPAARADVTTLHDDSGADDMQDDDTISGAGATARWDGEITRLMRERNCDAREAARVLQLREPNLFHQRREEFAGHRLPKTVSRNNRHMGISDY